MYVELLKSRSRWKANHCEALQVVSWQLQLLLISVTYTAEVLYANAQFRMDVV